MTRAEKSRWRHIKEEAARLAVDPQSVLAGAPSLERWKVVGRAHERTMIGFVFGHPLIDDGRFVETSPIVRIDLENGWVRTRNRLYRLGLPFDDVRGVQ